MIENKDQRRPIIDPLILLGKSRRVMLSVIKLVWVVVVLALPTLQPIAPELLFLTTVIYLALVIGLSIEDAARAARKQTLPTDWREALIDAIETTITRLANTSPPPTNDETEAGG